MNLSLSKVANSYLKTSMLYTAGLLLLLVSSASLSANTINLQCGLAANSQIKPEVITSMIEAADNGYLYRVDARSSDIKFQVNHFPFSSVEGHFSDFRGGLTLPDDIKQSRQALFLIKVDSVSTGDSELDEYLKSSVFFDATRFPDIIFVSTGFEWIDDSSARLHGELTLRGMTKPLVFTVHIDRRKNRGINKKQTMILLASAEIHRSDFGMHQMQIFISDTVQFNLKIEATLAGI